MKWLSFFVVAMCTTQLAHAYDRAQLSQWLQEQQFRRIIDYAAAVSESEQDVFLWNTAGYAAAQYGSNAAAASFFEKTLAKEPHNPLALLQLGVLEKSESRYQPALQLFRRLIASTPSNSRAYLLAAECHTALKHADSARLMLLQGNAVDPTAPKLAIAHAEAQMEVKQFEEADKALKAALAADSANAAVMSTMVKSAYLQNKWRQALALCKQMTVMGQVRYTPLLYGMLAALRLRDFDQCLSLAQILITTGNESQEVYYYASKGYAGLGQYASSNDMLRRCLALAISENASLYYSDLSANYAALKSPGKALACLDTAYYLFKDPAALYSKGLLLEQSGDTLKAKKAFQEYLKTSPARQDTAVARYLRGWMERH